MNSSILDAALVLGLPAVILGVMLVVIGVVVYGFVRFIKWAWNRPTAHG